MRISPSWHAWPHQTDQSNKDGKIALTECYLHYQIKAAVVVGGGGGAVVDVVSEDVSRHGAHRVVVK